VAVWGAKRGGETEIYRGISAADVTTSLVPYASAKMKRKAHERQDVRGESEGARMEGRWVFILRARTKISVLVIRPLRISVRTGLATRRCAQQPLPPVFAFASEPAMSDDFRRCRHGHLSTSSRRLPATPALWGDCFSPGRPRHLTQTTAGEHMWQCLGDSSSERLAGVLERRSAPTRMATNRDVSRRGMQFRRPIRRRSLVNEHSVDPGLVVPRSGSSHQHSM
jgi:hypothetical protein